MSEEPKPCPFCKQPAITNKGTRWSCFQGHTSHLTKEAWNTRPIEQHQAARIAQLERLFRGCHNKNVELLFERDRSVKQQAESHATEIERLNGEIRELTDANRRLANQVKGVEEKLDWQNMPNRNPAARGGYEFYVNEEWTGIRDAALDTETGFHASLLKARFDPDDERVRIRRVIDDDAILSDLAHLRAAAKQMAAALEALYECAVDKGDSIHADLCPEDDTCECRIPLLINSSLAAFNALQ